jgi:hypothetical protein
MNLTINSVNRVCSGFAFFTVTLSSGFALAATEEPKYSVLLKEDAFELRQYAAQIVAETAVNGDMDSASSQGFRAIADFIFGNNKAPGQNTSAKIAMTAPVTVQPRTQENSLREAKDWRIQFVMPADYTMATLPKPNNQAVQLREVPAQRFAVLRYSGLNTESKVEDKTNELLAWVKTKNWQMAGSPQLSRYDPPWTLPMWRRNELRVEVITP